MGELVRFPGVHDADTDGSTLPAGQPVTPTVPELPVPAEKPSPIPLLLRDAEHRRNVWDHALYLAKYHTLHPAWLWWPARGLGRSVRAWWRWVQAHEERAETKTTKAKAGKGGRETRDFVVIDGLQRSRWRKSLICGFVGTVASAVTWYNLGPGGWGEVFVDSELLLLATACGWAGRPVAALLTGADSFSRRNGYDLLAQAHREAGVLPDETVGGEKIPQDLKYVVLAHTDGDGVSVVYDVPCGTADAVIAKRVEIAGGLGIDEDRLVMARVRGDEGNARRVRMWIANEDPWAAGRPAFPLVSAESWSVWDGVPIGVADARREPVVAPLLWTNWAVAAEPRMGKTLAVLLLISGAVLDPTVRIIGADGKGGIDLEHLAKVALCFIEDEEPDSIARLADVLEAEVERMRTVRKHLKANRHLFPQGKITPGCGIEPTLIVLDEAHKYTPSEGDPPRLREVKARIVEALDELMRRGPFLGYTTVLATQDLMKESVPTRLIRRCGTRLAFKVGDAGESYRVLGKAKAQVDASKLPAPGIGILATVSADETNLAGTPPQQVMTCEFDQDLFEEICARGRALRETAGTLYGDAAGPVDEPGPDPRLVEVLAVFERAGVDRMRPSELAGLLREAGVTGPKGGPISDAQVGVLMSELGCRSRPIQGVPYFRAADIRARVAPTEVRAPAPTGGGAGAGMGGGT